MLRVVMTRDTGQCIRRVQMHVQYNVVHVHICKQWEHSKTHLHLTVYLLKCKTAIAEKPAIDRR